MRIGVIGGTGFYDLLEDAETVPVETPYGTTPVAVGRDGDRTLFFLNRHGAQHVLPPHRIDARATIAALAHCQVDAIIAVNNTGGLHTRYKSGHLVVPDDFVDLTGRADGTFFDETVAHVDLSEPYCRHVRQALLSSTRPTAKDGDPLHEGGVYVGVRGPRLETPAEVRWLATLGDVVGMTGCPEAALARERGICYASLCFVANPAAGLGGRLSATGIRDAFTEHLPRLRRIVRSAARAVPAERDCGCAEAPAWAQMGPPGGTD